MLWMSMCSSPAGCTCRLLSKGSENKADTVKSNDQVLVRFMEYSILDKDTTLSNLAAAETVDEFRYTVTHHPLRGLSCKDI